MYNKETSIKGILDFLKSEEKYLLLKGTKLFEKHSLVLTIVLEASRPNSIILFRINHKQNAKEFLTSIVKLKTIPQPGCPIEIRNKNLFVDTINRASWGKTPASIDYAIIYPIDSLNIKTCDDNLSDLEFRNSKKIFLVTSLLNDKQDWIDRYNPRIVTYDVEEMNIQNKNGVKTLDNITKEKIISGLPSYVKNISSSLLIIIYCQNCNKQRWAKLNKDFPGIEKLRSAELGEYIATCLMCGYTAKDNYNWGII